MSQHLTHSERVKMIHKQTGFQATNHVPQNATKLAILHGTCIAALCSRCNVSTIWLNCSGYHTRATCKAINGFLKDSGLGTYLSVRLKDGTIVATYDPIFLREPSHIELVGRSTVELNDHATFVIK